MTGGGRAALRADVAEAWRLALSTTAAAGSPDDVPGDVPFGDLGGDSAAAVALGLLLEERFGPTLGRDVAYTVPTLDGQVERLATGGSGPSGPPAPPEQEATSAAARPVRTPEPAPVRYPPGSIAVVGAAIRAPGARTVPQYWDLLCSGRSVLGRPVDGYRRVDEIGGFLDDVASFDHRFFGMTRADAAAADPQQRLVAELAWEALEAAGHAGSERPVTGIFVGATRPDYDDLIGDDARLNGSLVAIIANRVSYALDLTGPSECIDTACSSSLVAVHRAAAALRDGDCDLALAGGVSLVLTDRRYRLMRANEMISPTGGCHPFTAAADGMVPGEGGGMVALRRLDDALAAGDPVLAVLTGSATGSDGRSNGLNAPNPLAQRRVVAAAWQRAGVVAADIGYVEAHGTGTPAGDPMERSALAHCLAGRVEPCPIGSVKGQIGHLEWAAGIAGLIKVVLCVHHGMLPPSGGLTGRTPLADPAGLTRVVTATTPWPGRHAGVSSFGAGGTNCHVVVSVAPPVPAHDAIREPLLLTVSARTPAALAERIAALRGLPADPADVVAAASSGRGSFAVRAAVRVPRAHELDAVLGSALGTLGDSAVVVDGAPPPVAWVGDDPAPVTLWLARGLRPALFVRAAADRLAEALGETDPQTVVVSPDPGAGVAARAAGRRFVALAAPGTPERESAVHAVTELFLSGLPVHLDGSAARARVPWLPGYPFEREPAWVPARSEPTAAAGPRAFVRRWSPAEPGAEPAPPVRAVLLAGPAGPLADRVADGCRAAGLAVVAPAADGGAPDGADPLAVVWTGAAAVAEPGAARAVRRARDVGSFLDTGRAVARAGAGRVPRLLVITAGSADGVPDPVSAMIAAAVPSMARDLGGRTAVSHLDVSGGLPVDAVPRLLSAPADLWAVRDGRWLRPHWTPGVTSPSTEPAPGPIGLITGGLGALGSATAAWLAARGVTTLHLLGRHDAPPRDRWEADARLRRLVTAERAGATVVTHRVDVTDPYALTALVERIRRDGRIDAVVHAAGSADDRHVGRYDPADLRERWAAKVDGADLLDALFSTQAEAPSIFWLYSSAVVPVGNAGQVEYAAANGYLDAIAVGRRARGLPARSVQWSTWEGAGMAAVPAVRERLSAIGLRPMPGPAALDALGRCTDPDPVICVALDAPGSTAPGSTAPGPSRAPSPPVTVPAPHPAPEAARRPSAPAAAVATLDVVAAALRHRLDDPAAGLDENFFDIGATSLDLTEVVEQVNARLGTAADPVLALEAPTARLLAAAFDREPRRTPREPPQPAAVPTAVTRVAGPVREPDPRPTDIAVVGMSCRFPGASDPRAFWELIRSGRSMIGRTDPGDLLGTSGEPRPAALLAAPYDFDPLTFRLSPVEAAAIDPQQRLALELAWEALEDAGLAGRHADTTGVYLGAEPSRYAGLAPLTRHTAVAGANTTSLVANRVSYALRLGGPSLVCDTACSSAGTALHLARTALVSGDCDMAIAGGVKVLVDDRGFAVNEAAGLLSPSGRLAAFADGADGYVRGEGGALLVLRRLDDALAAGERVLAVLKGSRIAHDAADKAGLSAPSGERQRRLLLSAWASAGVDPGRLAFVEGHGTGTALGDPVEVRALAAALAEYAPRARPWLGSVKACIGHTEAAAGAAGAVKAVLALQAGEVPPEPAAAAPSSRIDWAELPLRLARTGTAFDVAGPAQAGVSCFGFGGATAHLVFEQAPAPAAAVPPVGGDATGHVVVPVSARTATALRETRRRLAAHLQARPEVTLSDLARTLTTGRWHAAERAAVVTDSRAGLARWLAGDDPGPGGGGPEGLRAAAATWIGGGDPGWPVAPGRLVGLPTYPFERTTCLPPELRRRTEPDGIPGPGSPAPPERRWRVAETVWTPLGGIDRGRGGSWTVLGEGPDSDALRGRLPSGEPAAHRTVWVLPEPTDVGDWDALLDRCRRLGAEGGRLVAVCPHHGDDPVRHGAVAGLVRALADEATGLDVTLLHVDGPDPARLVAEALDGLPAGPELLLRGGAPAGPTVLRRAMVCLDLTATAPDPAPIRRALITGGWGGIGRTLAAALADLGAEDIVLLGRRTPDDAEADALVSALRARGVTIRSLVADVTDHAEVASVLGPVGHLDLVVHAAGVFDHTRRSLRRKEGAGTVAVLAPKIDGTRALLDALAADPPDRVVLCSSLSAIGAGLAGGQADYAAANGYLDALAERGATAVPGTHVLAIGWPQWADTGMSRGRPPVRGLRDLTPDEGADAFAALLRSGRRGVVHIVPDGVRSDELLGARAGPGRPEPAPAPPAAQDAAAALPPPADLRELVRRTLAVVLGLDADAARSVDDFLAAGLDSLGVADLAGGLEAELGMPVDPADLMVNPSVTAAARILAERVGEHSPRAESVGTTHAGPEPVAPEPVAPPAPDAADTPDRQPGPATAGTRPRPRERRPVRVDVAVVGLAARLPGADTVDAFWRRLRSGTDAVTEIPPSRWDGRAGYDPAGGPGRSVSRWGGFLTGAGDFDHGLFGLTREHAELVDPLQRLFLETAWSAMRDAGRLGSSALRGGVFVGTRATGDAAPSVGTSAALDREAVVGHAQNFVAARVAHHLDLRGPALVVDTACSSSLVAVHLAARSLASGECDVAIAGGVDLLTGPASYAALSAAGALSRRGRCAAFAATADGYVPAEGVVAFVLRPLDEAVADGDRVYAVLRGSAVTNDGRTLGLTTPNVDAQREVLRAAYALAEIDPATVGMVEAHGTGTPIGDPAEVRALADVLDGPGRTDDCVIGSVKSNLGHLHSAAGAAGLLKAVLCVHHSRRVPSLHVDEPNPRLRLGATSFRVGLRDERWDAPTRVAGVSAFGFGGTNCHVVVSEAPAADRGPSSAGSGVLLLSGRSERELEAEQAAVRGWVDVRDGSHPVGAYSAALGDGRGAFGVRIALRGDDAALRAGLTGPVAGRAVTAPSGGRTTFLFTGQGSQYVGMARDACDTSPAFAEAFEQAAGWLRPRMGSTWERLCLGGDDGGPEDFDPQDTFLVQPALFAVQYAATQLWRAMGVVPDLVVGHSIGEYAAMVCAGLLDGPAAAELVAVRARAVAACPAGAMVGVALPAAETTDLLGDLAGDVDVAAVNSPGEVVLSGSREAVRAAAERLREHRVRAVPLRVSHGFHSRLMQPAAEALDAHRGLDRAAATTSRIRMISTVTGEDLDRIPDGYPARQVRAAVRFADAVRAAAAAGSGVFVEIGPGDVLTRLVGAQLGDTAVVVGGSSARRPERERLLDAAATLWEAGCAPRVRELCPVPPVLGTLPVFPFDRTDLGGLPPSAAQAGVVGPDAGPEGKPGRGAGYLDGIEETPGAGPAGSGRRGRRRFLPSEPVLADHVVGGRRILPGVSWLTMAHEMLAGDAGDGGLTFDNITFRAPLEVGPDEHDGRLGILDLAATSASGWALTGSSSGADGPVTHVRARVRLGADAVPALDRAALWAAGGDETDADTLYARIRDQHIVHGPWYRCLVRARGDDRGAVAELRLGPDASAVRTGLPPALLDGATTVGAAVAGHAPWRSGASYIPLHIGSVAVFGPLPEAVWCHYRLGTTDAELAVFDFDIAGDDGRVLVAARDFASKRVPEGFARPAAGPSRPARPSIRTVRWIPEGLLPGATAEDPEIAS